MRLSGATPGYLTFLLVSHTFSNWLHNLSWFIICDREGSVATGLLQGLKAVLLFGGSSLAFCSRQESQCMTRHKVLATAIVVAGTAIYYLAPSTSPAELAASRDAAKGAEQTTAYELVPKPDSQGVALGLELEDDDKGDSKYPPGGDYEGLGS